MSRHHVQVHNWSNGELSTFEAVVDSIEEAMAKLSENVAFLAHNSDSHTVKIYDLNGELVHSVSGMGTGSDPIASLASYA